MLLTENGMDEVAPSSFHVLLLSMAAPAKCGRPAWTSGGVALFFGTGPFSTPTLNMLSERAVHLTWLRRTELLLIDRLILRLLRKSWNRSRRKALSNRLLLRL